MSRMAEQAQDQMERENESGMDLCEAYYESQQALPAHKRDGYSERMQEALEAQHDEIRECFGTNKGA